MKVSKEERQTKWAKVVSKAWNDPGFKKKLLANPTQILKENGLEVESGTLCKVHENTETMTHFVLPLKPTHECSEEELKSIVAGASMGFHVDPHHD